MMGCAFSNAESPAVEYRVWPMARTPRIEARRRGEDIGDQAHGLVLTQDLAVGSDDARRFLSAMLQGVQAKISELSASGWAWMATTPHSSRNYRKSAFQS